MSGDFFVPSSTSDRVINCAFLPDSKAARHLLALSLRFCGRRFHEERRSRFGFMRFVGRYRRPREWVCTANSRLQLKRKQIIGRGGVGVGDKLRCLDLNEGQPLRDLARSHVVLWKCYQYVFNLTHDSTFIRNMKTSHQLFRWNISPRTSS